MLERRRRAMRRRLQDRPRQRWFWAVGSALPLLGLPLLLVHAWTRRSLLPFLYGLMTQALVGFVVLTLGGPAVPGPGASRQGSADSGLLLLTLLAGGGFALGHRVGQELAARDGERWLWLDQED